MLKDVMVLRVFQEAEFQVPAIEAPAFDKLAAEIDSKVDGYAFTYRDEEVLSLWKEFHEKYDRYFVQEAD